MFCRYWGECFVGIGASVLSVVGQVLCFFVLESN